MNILRKILYSFRYRIILLYSAAMVLSIAFIGYFSISVVSEYIIDNIEKEMQQTTNELGMEINHIFDQTTSLINLASHAETTHFITVSGQDELYLSAKDLGKTYSMMRQSKQIPDYVTDICVIGCSGACYSERNGYFTMDTSFYQNKNLSRISESPKAFHIYEHPIFVKDFPWEKESLAFTRAIYQLGTTEIIGVIQICLNKNYLSDLLKSYKTHQNSHIFIVDSKGALIFPAEEKANHQLFTGYLTDILKNQRSYSNSIATVSGEKYLFFNKFIPSTGWSLISTVHYNELLKPASGILKWVFIALTGGLLFAIILNIFITSTVVRPIERLSSVMKRAVNKDHVRIPSSKITEIDSLYQSFDTMVCETRDLMQKMAKKQHEQKKMELQILQEQINPHFLYNSLESIIWAASNGKSEQVEELTLALARFYRMALSKGMDIVPLRQELSLVDNYLKIMKIQYGDLFDYCITADEELSNCWFPKLILQPIAENSIYHGLQRKRTASDAGIIEIIASKKGPDRLEIMIRDNGAGIEPELLQKLRKHEQIPFEEHSSGFGLKNIDQRIKLYFGEDYGIFIESISGAGTSVSIQIPSDYQAEKTEKTRNI